MDMLEEFNVTYSDIEGDENWIPEGEGNIDADPWFSDSENEDTWPALDTNPETIAPIFAKLKDLIIKKSIENKNKVAKVKEVKKLEPVRESNDVIEESKDTIDEENTIQDETNKTSPKLAPIFTRKFQNDLDQN